MTNRFRQKPTNREILLVGASHDDQGKKQVQNFISSRDGPLETQKQGRDKNTPDDYPTMEQWRKRNKKPILHRPHLYAADVGQFSCLSFSPIFYSTVVLLRAFVPALFLYFTGLSLLEMKFCRKFSPLVFVKSFGGLKPRK